MLINSLNAIIDDIILELRNSSVAESEHISRYQIEQWIHNYRARLIKEAMDKGYEISSYYYQTYGPLHISKVETAPGHYEYVTDKKIPSQIDSHHEVDNTVIKDLYDNLIQLGNETKAKLQKYRKYTCNDYIAYFKNGNIQLEGPGYLEWIQMDGLFEDPTAIGDCFNADDQVYPVPASMISVIKQLIFANELNVMMQVATDLTNDNKDNNLAEARRVRSTYERSR